jgi:hypothetical protein
MTSEDDSDFEDVLEAERVKRHLISRRCLNTFEPQPSTIPPPLRLRPSWIPPLLLLCSCIFVEIEVCHIFSIFVPRQILCDEYTRASAFLVPASCLETSMDIKPNANRIFQHWGAIRKYD